MKKNVAAFSAWCAQRDDKKGISVERGILQVSYTVRVMLAHIRIKYKAWGKGSSEAAGKHPEELTVIYMRFEKAPQGKQKPLVHSQPFVRKRYKRAVQWKRRTPQ